MIIKPKVIEQLYNVCESSKKVSRMNFSKEEFERWCQTINAINALRPNVTNLQGNNLSDYKILNVLSDMIMPRTITVDGRLAQNDFLVCEDTITTNVMNAYEFEDIQRKIAGAMRKEFVPADVMPLRQVDVTLASVGSRQTVNDHVKYEGGNFWPITLSVNVYPEYAYNYDVVQCCRDWFIDAINK